MVCPGSLKVVRCSGLARVVTCPVCGRKTRPLRKTLSGQYGQVRSHSAPEGHESNDASATQPEKRRRK